MPKNPSRNDHFSLQHRRVQALRDGHLCAVDSWPHRLPGTRDPPIKTCRKGFLVTHRDEGLLYIFKGADRLEIWLPGALATVKIKFLGKPSILGVRNYH